MSAAYQPRSCVTVEYAAVRRDTYDDRCRGEGGQGAGGGEGRSSHSLQTDQPTAECRVTANLDGTDGGMAPVVCGGQTGHLGNSPEWRNTGTGSPRAFGDLGPLP